MQLTDDPQLYRWHGRTGLGSCGGRGGRGGAGGGRAGKRWVAQGEGGRRGLRGGRYGCSSSADRLSKRHYELKESEGECDCQLPDRRRSELRLLLEQAREELALLLLERKLIEGVVVVGEDGAFGHSLQAGFESDARKQAADAREERRAGGLFLLLAMRLRLVGELGQSAVEEDHLRGQWPLESQQCVAICIGRSHAAPRRAQT